MIKIWAIDTTQEDKELEENDVQYLLSADQQGILMECDYDTAKKYGNPQPAKDGVWVAESGQETLIANGKVVGSYTEVANALGWLQATEEDAQGYLEEICAYY